MKEHIDNIKKNGYTILKDVITAEECDHYKGLLEATFEKYSPKYYTDQSKSSHSLQSKINEKVVYNLHNKDMDWYKLFENENVASILDVMLKEGSYKNQEPYHLLNISARTPLNGTGEQQLHLDSNLPGGDFPIIMVVLWMFDDFTKESGATRIVPGSHKFSSYALDGKSYESEIQAVGKKGSVLIYNASLWHGGANNMTNRTRWSLVLGYGRWFIKPSYDFFKNTPDAIYQKLSDAQKELLGFKSAPPIDEFTRTRRRSDIFESPNEYNLPK
jgi:ectoine hydroxylase-related dioxygenase (phytanoyl-CoA dioxygenase family)